jgi:hypothetical protein
MRVEAVVVLLVIVATGIVITAWMRSSALRAVTLSAMIGSEKK